MYTIYIYYNVIVKKYFVYNKKDYKNVSKYRDMHAMQMIKYIIITEYERNAEHNAYLFNAHTRRRFFPLFFIL